MQITVNFRRDSGVYCSYYTMEKVWNNVRRTGSGNPQKDIDEIIFNKTHLAIWIVSNCDYTSGAIRRKNFVFELVDAGLKVDLRGRCFSKNRVPSIDVIKKYKVYLAFENGYHCKDYITEKLFFNSYMMGTVPIVWGATNSDYKAIRPSDSFIFAEDFKTPRELVKYLNYLDKNDTAYREYFSWRTKNVTEMPQYGGHIGLCHLCRIINGFNEDNIFNPDYEKLKTDTGISIFGHPNKSKVIPSLAKWYYGTENPECFQQSHHSFKNFLLKCGL